MTNAHRAPRQRSVTMARVLLVDADPTSRLTLKTVLEAGGYAVETAASAAEAIGLLQDLEFELVLTDLHMDPPSGLNVLTHARLMPYRPATALIQRQIDESSPAESEDPAMLIEAAELPELLSNVARLISQRASRLLARELRMAAAAAAY
jgi:CheY-like chemotaxis protein